MKTPKIRTQWEDGNSPMIPTPQPYPHYKPSHVDWLGDVPAHWDVYGNSDALGDSLKVRGELRKTRSRKAFRASGMGTYIHRTIITFRFLVAL